MILQSLRLMKKRKNNCYKHSPSFYFANVCSLSPSCLLNGNGSFSQLPVQNNYKISALSFAFFGVALSASPSAALTLNASSFSFKDTLAAGTSVYCLPPLFCPYPSVSPQAGYSLQNGLQPLYLPLTFPAHLPCRSRHCPFRPC